MQHKTKKLEKLIDKLRHFRGVAIAVSGGVDSLTLAVIAGRHAEGGVEIFHARSAAVPPEATLRVRDLAEQERWDLKVIDAGEFGVSSYVSNPVDRCFYCKTALYETISRLTTKQIISGTNFEDLSDYRPGLIAAKNNNVRHPYAELEISKADIRFLAKCMKMGDIADLPSSPCLSSRIETGIPIHSEYLRAINESERALNALLNPRVVRCRVRANRVSIELDADTLARLFASEREQIVDIVRNFFITQGKDLPTVDLVEYKRGSAFLIKHD